MVITQITFKLNKPYINSLLRQKRTKEMIIHHKEQRTVKELKNGVQTTNLKKQNVRIEKYQNCHFFSFSALVKREYKVKKTDTKDHQFN